MKHILFYATHWMPLLFYISLILFFSTSSLPKEVKHIPDFILHTFEYMTLGLFLYHSFANTFTMKPLKLGIILVAIGLSIGILDEIVQSFTPTRDASLKDLLVDFAALSLSQIILYYLDKHKKPMTQRLP